MDFTKQQKAWLLLIFILIGASCTQIAISYAGGCKLWLAILGGVGTGATAVVTALMKSPNDPSHKEETNNEKTTP